MNTLFRYFDPADLKQGLPRLILCSLLLATVGRALLNPELAVFRPGEAGAVDYWAMIGMSAFLIAIDAMLLVVLSWKNLRDWRDALAVSALVGATHVVFPLTTFCVTALVTWFSRELGLPEFLASGMQTAIYFVALFFVVAHLREIHSASRDPESTLFEPGAPVSSWKGIREIFPAVFAVSIDALMVGPAKVAFMDRYEFGMFLSSFVYVGVSVFVLVLLSGVIVLALKAFLEHGREISNHVHRLDWLGNLVLIGVFIHFSIFAAVYVLYTFVPMEWLLRTDTIWSATALVFAFYLVFGKISEIRAASQLRAGLE